MENETFTLAEALSEYAASIKQCVVVFTPTWKYSDDVDLINAAWSFYEDKMPFEIHHRIKNSDWGFMKFPTFDMALAHARSYFPFYCEVDPINPRFRIDCMIYDEEGKLAWTNELL